MESISIVRPLYLWPHFNKAFEFIAGYPADNFEFIVGQTPLSTFNETFLFVVSYYVIIFGGRELMRDRAPFQLSSLFLAHNFCLAVISGVLLALYIESIVPTLMRKGVLFAICDIDGGWTQHLVVLYYLTLLTKYLEFLDTVFLILKKRPLTFLHCYHHGATAVLCYTQLIGHTAVSWVVITLSLAVHCIMYWYYFQSTRGVRVWWKEWVTRLQVIQFMIDLGFVYFASYTYFASTYFPWMPHMGSCAGEEFAALIGIGVLTSYLVLFLGFYFATYRKDVKPRSSRGTLRPMSEAEAITSSGVEATKLPRGNLSMRAREM